MARAPELGDSCRPGGSCPVCNPAPVYCQTCLITEVDDITEPCEACAEEARLDRIADAAMTEERI